MTEPIRISIESNGDYTLDVDSLNANGIIDGQGFLRAIRENLYMPEGTRRLELHISDVVEGGSGETTVSFVPVYLDDYGAEITSSPASPSPQPTFRPTNESQNWLPELEADWWEQMETMLDEVDEEESSDEHDDGRF